MPADVRVPLAGVPPVAAHTAFERGGRHHQLEGRTHVILREGAVDERAVGVLQACREVVRVVGRHRDGRLDVARGDVHHHRRALFDPLHRPLGDPLEVRVEGERDAPLALVVVPQHLGRVEGEGVSRRVEGVAQLEAAVILLEQVVVRHLDARRAVRLFRVEVADDVRRELFVPVAFHRVDHLDPLGVDLLLHREQVGLRLRGARGHLLPRLGKRGERLGRGLHRRQLAHLRAHKGLEVAVVNDAARVVHIEHERALGVRRRSERAPHRKRVHAADHPRKYQHQRRIDADRPSSHKPSPLPFRYLYCWRETADFIRAAPARENSRRGAEKPGFSGTSMSER